jgi:azurin
MIRNIALVIFAASALAGRAFSSEPECSLTVEANDQIQYLQKELTVSSSCAQVTVTLMHIGKLPANVMGHNWVLAATEDYQALAQAGQGVGPPDYLPPDDPRVIAHTPIIGGGEQTSVMFDISELEPGGDYTFFCSFPGHFVLMNGKFIVT